MPEAFTDLRTWDVSGDVAPGDFLIGHLSGEYVADQDSLGEASVAILSATFVRAGLEAEQAIDKAYDYMERGARITFDGESLSFEFKDDDDA